MTVEEAIEKINNRIRETQSELNGLQRKLDITRTIISVLEDARDILAKIDKEKANDD